MNSIHVAMGEMSISNDKETTLDTFVGSCIALCLYDPYAIIAGMAHIMLPKNSEGKVNRNNAGKYADQAVETTIKIMIEQGANIKRIRASMAGGAKIFSDEGGNGLFNIGEKNTEAVKYFLREKKIPLISFDVGMNHGRWVKFNVKSGKVTVSNTKHKEKSVYDLRNTTC